ncbi:MAG TPA: hypothetical protein VE986_09170 [Hyphomicrobiales bacterium]|nr:hypothetical protein [Hyphomicrobiales bacterium]
MLSAVSARLGCAFGLALASVAPLPAAAQTPSAKPRALAVEVTNASTPESCAEKDNVTINFASISVRRFRIEAAHPVYLGSSGADRREADWTDCDIPHDDEFPAPTERRITFYESPFLWVTGYEVSDYWRRRDVPVRIGERVEHNLTMVQLWVFVRGKAEQVLVLYPTDGIWRIHPLPPANHAWTSYGSSFLVGPIENKEVPLVEIKEVAFHPESRTFRLAFEDGSTGTVKVGEIDDNHIVLDVGFDRAIAGKPFAALRSMYVTEFNADVARIALLRPDEKSWFEAPIMAFTKGKATKVWMGRLLPSRHNFSAPDMVFASFSAPDMAVSSGSADEYAP